MQAKTLIATALVLSFAGVGAAFAQEGTQDFPAPQWKKPTSSLTRAEVMAESKAALADRTYGEASAAPKATSMLSRAQVVAETREAIRLGVVGVDEATQRTATPAQAEMIRAAGLRTLDNSLAQASK